MKRKDHPTIQWYEANKEIRPKPPSKPIDSNWLKQLCLDAGAEDVGFVHIDNPAIADQRETILEAFPRTKVLISLVQRMNREPVRSTYRSVANNEFHEAGHDINKTMRSIVTKLLDQNIPAMNPPMAFPMEMDNFLSDKPIWIVSHKPVAEAAGLGVMGIHRNVIHPKFGNFILLGTILLGAEVDQYDRRLDYNPCFECKLCVAACPVGAIASDGHFNASACMTHNYREFMGGFVEWAERLADSSSAAEYRQHESPSEDASRWQSFTGGANYKTAYCMAVCPAGEDVIGPYLDDKRGFLNETVKPFQQKEEVIFATANSDAVGFVTKRYPHKTLKIVEGGLAPPSVKGFVHGAHIVFQRNQAKSLNATYHFTFTGSEEMEVTFDIRDGKLTVSNGLVGSADLHITADSDAWVRLLNKRLNPVWGIVSRKIKLKGDPRLLLKFEKCFA